MGVLGVPACRPARQPAGTLAHELRDGIATVYDGAGVLGAVRNVTKAPGPAILGMNACDQSAIDARLIELDGTPNKSHLGANALLGISVATARAAAVCRRLPVWRHLAGSQQP